MSRFPKQLIMLALAALMLLFAVPAIGQTSDELERIREERRELQEELAEKAKNVDVTLAEINDLAEALEILEANVIAKELRVSDSERQLASTREQLVEARANVIEMEAEILERNERLSARAVQSWLNQGTEPPLLVESEDPTQASRMQQLVGSVTGTEADMANELRELNEDLEVERAIAGAANTEANTIQARLRIELAGLEAAKEAAQKLANEAEARLEHLLSEQQSLRSLDNDLADDLEIETERLREVLKRAASEGGPTAPVTDRSEIERVNTHGATAPIYVHLSIEPALRNMLQAAADDGILLGGGGYRDSTKQVQLRIANCGSSDYAIWEMPPSRCSPPTARPGRSLHERGLAIDFTNNGRAINTRTSSAYKWLRDNARDYGFFNLPSEPWHWSTTGG